MTQEAHLVRAPAAASLLSPIPETPGKYTNSRKFLLHESDSYGPFNSLPVDLFPVSEHYQVSPQFKRIDGSLDITVQFIVCHRRFSSWKSRPSVRLRCSPPVAAQMNKCARGSANLLRARSRRQPSMASALSGPNFVFTRSKQPLKASIRQQSLATCL
jgi:hypothetical protein